MILHQVRGRQDPRASLAHHLLCSLRALSVAAPPPGCLHDVLDLDRLELDEHSEPKMVPVGMELGQRTNSDQALIVPKTLQTVEEL